MIELLAPYPFIITAIFISGLTDIFVLATVLVFVTAHIFVSGRPSGSSWFYLFLHLCLFYFIQKVEDLVDNVGQ